MSIKRRLMPLCAIALTIAFGLIAVEANVSAAATVGHAAKHHKKKKKKKTCPKGYKKNKKGDCLKTVTKIQTKENTAKLEQEIAAKVKAEGEAAAEKAKAAAEAAGKTKAESEAAAEKAKVAAEAAAKAKAEGEAAAEKAKAAAEAAGKTTAEAEAAAQKKRAETEAIVKANAENELNTIRRKATIVEEEEASEKAQLAANEKPVGEGACEKGSTAAIETEAAIPRAPAFEGETLNAQPCGNWLSSPGGTSGDHYSALTEITPANVSNLKAAWVTQLDGSGEGSKDSAEAPPAEYDGVIYYVTGSDDVFAVSVASGKILWAHASEVGESVADVCCGYDNRGVSLGGGLVYTDVVNGYVEALSQQTGQLVWKTELGQPNEGMTVTAAPTYYNGMIFEPVVGSDYSIRGFMEGFNAVTGELVWKHYDIPAPGEFGGETWPHNTSCHQCNNEWLRGGSGSWNGPTIDDKTHDIYYSTANDSPTDQGVTRAGENLWSVSLLALNYKTGAFQWGYQMVHHDVWDYDASAQPVMVNVKIGGKTVEGIAQANKDGFLYFVNAETGLPVFPIEEKPIAYDEKWVAEYPTQPIPTMPPFLPTKASTAELAEIQTKVNTSVASDNTKLAKADTEEPDLKLKGEGKAILEPGEPVTVVNGGYEEDDVFNAAWPYPGLGAEKNTHLKMEVVASGGSTGDHEGPPSYDPANDELFVCSRKVLTAWAETETPESPKEPGERFYGAHGAVSGSSSSDHGYVTAYNMEKGTVLWTDELTNTTSPTGTADPCYDGTMALDGMVLVPESESNLVAYEATTGKELWSFEMGAAGSPPAAFEWNGKEYIVDYAGGNEFVGDEKQSDALWAFQLNGTGHAPIHNGEIEKVLGAPPTKIKE